MARKVGNSRISAENAASGDANRSGGAGLRIAASAATATLTALSVVAALAGTADAATATGELSANLAPQQIGTAPAIPAGAVRTGATAGDTTLHMAVNLKPRDPAALAAFVAGVSDKSSSLYHHYLAAGQFAQTFGPTQSTIQTVEQALRNEGLAPGKVSTDGLSIAVTAPASAAAHAFGTQFSSLRQADGTSAYINNTAPELPRSVASLVSGITGLNSLDQMVANHTVPQKAAALGSAGRVRSQAVAPAETSPTVCSGLTTNLNNNGYYDTKRYYSPSALASVYGLTKSNTAGAGVTVGVFELENVSAANIADYQSCMGTHSSVSYVPVDGGPTAPPSVSTNIGVESALDIEDLIGLAPGASIIDYEGPDASSATNQNVLDVYQEMVTADQAKVLSTSWGECETDLDSGTLAAESNIFAEAAAQGQTVVAAAGDTGSTGCYRDGNPPTEASLVAGDPASQPYVTGVGGTWMNGTGATLKQATWNYGIAWASGGGSGSGGVSRVWSSGNATAPFNYQTGFTGSGYSNACGAPAGQACRQEPDVSALADPGAGYLIALDDDEWYFLGATSGAAPTWAAMLAQADASAGCKTNGSVGQLNPELYTAARTTYSSSFYDVTTGTNDWTPSGYKGGDYPATAGYDMATGLGTPKYAGLLSQLCGTKTGGSAGTFFPVTPMRILDTRDGTGGFKAPLGANATDSLMVTGNNENDNVPAMNTGVTSVVLSVTAVGPTASSYVSVYGDGTGGGSATLDFTPGIIVPNTVVVPVKDGKVDFYNHSGSVNVVAVVTGYYSTATGGSGFNPITPAHLFDTRNGTGMSAAGAMGPNSTDTVQVTGAANVPNSSSVTAVALDVTAISGTASSYVGIYPGTSGPSAATSLSFAPGQIIANTEIVPVGTDGTIKFYNHSGTVNVTADVTGYYSTSGSGTTFTAVTPSHLLDTRNATGGFKPLGTGGTLSLPVVGVGGVPLNASAVVLNVTVVGPTGSSYVAAYPDPEGHAASTGLDFAAGETIANLVVVPVVDGKIDFYNHAGSVNVTADVLGYYGS
jgi:hypothetical protein